jgi:hypothetical protein
MTDTISLQTLTLCSRLLSDAGHDPSPALLAAVTDATDFDDRIGEKVLASHVQAVLTARGEDGIPTAEDRAVAAAGIIEARVRKAYKLGDPA